MPSLWKTTAKISDIRPINVIPQLTKVLEKAIKNKMEKIKSNILFTGV